MWKLEEAIFKNRSQEKKKTEMSNKVAQPVQDFSLPKLGPPALPGVSIHTL